MDFENSPYTPRSRQLSSEQQLSEDDINDRKSAAQWQNPLYSDSIDARLNKILSRAYKCLVGQSKPNAKSAINELVLLAQKINFLKNNRRQFDPKIQVLCYYNLACAYQNIAFTTSDIQALNECIKNINFAIHYCNTFVQNGKTNQWFKLNLFSVKMNLQYCALLSQTQKHNQALQLSKQTLVLIIRNFSKGLVQCTSLMNNLVVDIDDGVPFAHKVLQNAKQSLLDLANLQSYDEILEKDHSQFKKMKENNYFWKDNFENNQKTIRKGLQVDHNTENQPNRNILGLKVNHNWVNQFTIGKVMHMSPYQYQNFIDPDNIVMEFSQRNLMEKIIIASVCYFSIATQMRFMEGNQKSGKREQKIGMKKSEIFHLKAIEVVCKYIKTSSLYVDHLINSYHRHYHNDLVTIDEEPSFAEQSILSTNDRKENKSMNSPQMSQYFSQYEEILQDSNRKVEKNIKQPIFVFNKKKGANLLESGELDRQILSIAAKQKKLKKNDEDKLEKSSSISNYHSVKMDKKSSFSRSKHSNITMKMHKSPQPSIKLSKSKDGKHMKKKSRRLQTQR